MNPPANPNELITVLRQVELVESVLVVHLEGWIDAGASAATAMARAREAAGAAAIANFDTERLIDHRARRPKMRIVDGVNTGLEWPTIEFASGQDREGNDVLFLSGKEPDYNWRSFVAAVVGFAARHDITRMIGLGAYPAAVPHTRPVRLAVTANSRELAEDHHATTSLDVPAGIESALELAFATLSVPAMGLWAQVPHYVSTVPYPPASLALIEGLAEAAGLRLDAGPLVERAMIARRRLDDLVSGEPSHQEMVTELERRADDVQIAVDQLPTSDELAAQVEQFLREQDDNP